MVADIPGLIEGAADGAGIGDRFLGHIERCRVLLHLVDAHDDDVATSYRVVRNELEEYGADLVDKPVVVALNKVDMLDAELIAALSDELAQESGAPVFALSGATGRGMEAVLDKLLEAVGPDEHRARMSSEGEDAFGDDGDGDGGEGAWSPL